MDQTKSKKNGKTYLSENFIILCFPAQYNQSELKNKANHEVPK